MENGRIAVAMSGGVDSSTAAYLLKKKGYEVVGISMQMYDSLSRSDSEYGGCCTLDDLADARRVAWHLEIPHFVVNMEEGFHEKVIAPFVRNYLEGSTPSPCVLCNTHVKFESFHRKALTAGANKVATGHYARITRGSDGKFELRKARDLSKDQTYFLFELTQEQLAHAEFPLGELTKPEVRELAREAGLAVASKKESYEICFVPQRDGYSSIIENEARAMASEGDGLATAVAEGDAGGEIVDQDGRVLGHHDGYYHFTIGQRRGLQIGGLPERTYVIDVNPWTRRVVVGPESALEETELYCERTHWISGENPEGPVEVWARVRSRAAEIDAVVEPLGDGMSRVRFRAPVRAAAPGQAVVFYRDDLCLGGGWITRAQGSGSGSHGPGAGD
jgi:tRNA-uridine 2-sulfurtransferase